ncbi:MAG: hypothetical protein AB8I56_16855 [Anaerolineales bacterium]
MFKRMIFALVIALLIFVVCEAANITLVNGQEVAIVHATHGMLAGDFSKIDPHLIGRLA